ncbi:MAG TPA: hypothetical protein VHN12_02385 [Geobacteraceae bacterium]|nr:hypothetical protein [Geobacteraceae bacterium]
MPELLRTFRLGAINLFGVTIPGFILLLISGIGFLLPTLFLVFAHYNRLSTIEDAWYEYKWIIFVVIILLAYVSGYILRLTSPNKLDHISAHSMENTKEQSEVWNYKYEDEKFPYSGLKDYFNNHGHNDLSELVSWDSINKSDGNTQDLPITMCTNSTINRMKLDIALDCPELAAIVDSQEAHIRLMSGTWLAIRAAMPLVIIGGFICILVIYATNYDNVLAIKLLTENAAKNTEKAEYFGILFVLNVFMVMAMLWGNSEIVKLFHKRRVNELLIIYHAALRCKKLRESVPPGADLSQC